MAVAHDLRRGEWTACAATGWPDNSTCDQLLAWCWTDREQRTLVVVNDGDTRSTAMVHVPWTDLGGRTWRLDDLLGGASYERVGDDVTASGLYVALDARAFHVLRWTASGG